MYNVMYNKKYSVLLIISTVIILLLSTTSTVVKSNPYIQSDVVSSDPGGPYSGKRGEIITLDGSGSSSEGQEIIHYQWGCRKASADGSFPPRYDIIGTGEIITHTWFEEGLYEVYLSVFDAYDNVDMEETTVTISSEAVPEPYAVIGGSYTGYHPGEMITLDGSNSFDLDGEIIDYYWTYTTGESNLPIPIGHGKIIECSFDKSGKHMIYLTVTDNDGNTDTEEKKIYILSYWTRIDPGGPYVGVPGKTITLDGSNSGSNNPDVTIIDHYWTFTGGGFSSPQPIGHGEIVQYSWDLPGEYIITLAITDNNGKTFSHTTSLQILYDETYSNAGINVEKHVWNNKISQWDDEVTIDKGETVRFRLDVENTGDETFVGTTVIDTLPAEFFGFNSEREKRKKPFVSIAPNKIINGDVYTDIVWLLNTELKPGDTCYIEFDVIALNGGTAINSVKATGTYFYQNCKDLSDELFVSDEDEVTINILGSNEWEPAPVTVNTPPVANDDYYIVYQDSLSNDFNVLENDFDADGDTLFIEPIEVDPLHGSVFIKQGNIISYSPDPGYSGDDFLIYKINDGDGGSDTGTVYIEVVQELTPDDDPHNEPVADAGGPYTGSPGETITLDGSNSYDLDGEIRKYLWTYINSDDVNGVNPPEIIGHDKIITYEWDEEGTYTISLTVTDDDGLRNTDTTELTIISETGPPSGLEPEEEEQEEQPVADAGGPYTGRPGETITLDGSDSYDLDGEITDYLWTYIVNNEGGTTFQETIGHGKIITYEWDEEGDYTVYLKVTDDDGNTNIDTADITITSDEPDKTEPNSSILSFFLNFLRENFLSVFTLFNIL